MDIDLSDLSAPDLSDLSAPDLSDLDSADLSDTSDSATPDATSTPDLSTPVPDLTQTQTATPPTTDPYAMDPSQWDQDTRNYAALGDLHCMVDQHVRDYGTLPDSDTMDGFMNQICDTWGTPVTADANPADSPAASMAANVNQPDAIADDNPSPDQSVNQCQTSPAEPAATPATPEPAASTDASATPPQPTRTGENNQDKPLTIEIIKSLQQTPISEVKSTQQASCYKPITPQEQKMANEGNVEEFWKSRQLNGDPIADVALGTLGMTGSSSTSPTYRLEGQGANAWLEGNSLLNNGKLTDLDAVHKDLMQAHVTATMANGNGDQPLSDQQIGDYHHDVFGKYGLPPSAFGGTPLPDTQSVSNLIKGLWYNTCK